jgi:Viral (Superfamily 1) RNA helicase
VLAGVVFDPLHPSGGSVLEALDDHGRVSVTGGPGSGKTRLATAWVQRALDRGERALLCCRNDALAGELATHLPEHPGLTVCSWRDPWLRTLGQAFDAIAVDEAEDADTELLAELDDLFDPAGPRRLLVSSDERQRLHAGGFVPPSVEHGFALCEMLSNHRNGLHLTALLAERLGGPPAAAVDAHGFTFVESADLEAVIANVGDVTDEITDHDGHDPSQVLVIAFDKRVRDRLRDAIGYVAWELGDERSIICEHVHRAKGLTFDHVVLAATNDKMSDAMLYVAATRTASSLTIVGPPVLAARLMSNTSASGRHSR